MARCIVKWCRLTVDVLFMVLYRTLLKMILCSTKKGSAFGQACNNRRTLFGSTQNHVQKGSIQAHLQHIFHLCSTKMGSSVVMISSLQQQKNAFWFYIEPFSRRIYKEPFTTHLHLHNTKTGSAAKLVTVEEHFLVLYRIIFKKVLQRTIYLLYRELPCT